MSTNVSPGEPVLNTNMRKTMVKKTKPKITEEELNKFRDEHRVLEQQGQSLCLELSKQLEVIFQKNSIHLVYPIQFRVKKWSSLNDKFERLNLNVNSLKEIQDL